MKANQNSHIYFKNQLPESVVFVDSSEAILPSAGGEGLVSRPPRYRCCQGVKTCGSKIQLKGLVNILIKNHIFILLQTLKTHFFS